MRFRALIQRERTLEGTHKSYMFIVYGLINAFIMSFPFHSASLSLQPCNQIESSNCIKVKQNKAKQQPEEHSVSRIHSANKLTNMESHHNFFFFLVLSILLPLVNNFVSHFYYFFFFRNYFQLIWNMTCALFHLHSCSRTLWHRSKRNHFIFHSFPFCLVPFCRSFYCVAVSRFCSCRGNPFRRWKRNKGEMKINI